MLVFETNRSGRWRSIDLHNLPIAGTMAHKLTREDLLREVRLLGVPGIADTDGHQQISLAYGNWLQEKTGAAA